MSRDFSNQPDHRVLLIGRMMSVAALVLASFIGIAVLLLWFVPALDGLAPSSWWKMTSNTALGMVLSAFCVAGGLWQWRQGWRRAGMAAAILVLLLGLASLAEYDAHLSLGLDTLLPYRRDVSFPGRPSPHTALAFILLGLSMVNLRQLDNMWSRLSDIAAIMLSTLILLVLGGYIYGALDLVGIGATNLMAPHTLLCFCCLLTALVTQRAEQGELFSVMVDTGIGSRIVRWVLPAVILVPFIFLSTEIYLRQHGVFSAAFVQAVASASASTLSLGVVTWMGWRLNRLERELHGQSLTDELTGVYNRRGFYFLGQQAIRDAERAGSGMTVFFFDLDGLKRVNDVHGHEIGSEMIMAFSGILRSTFRKSDIIGRVGGDEFAVINLRDGDMSLVSTVARLHQLANAYNFATGKSFRLSFSIGSAALRHGRSETLEDIITRADAMMYQDKARKKLAA